MTKREFDNLNSAPKVKFMEFAKKNDHIITRKIERKNIFMVSTSPPDQDLNINGIPTNNVELPLMTTTQKNSRFNPTIPRPGCTVTVKYKDNKLIEINSVPTITHDNRVNKKLNEQIEAHSFINTYSFEEDMLIEETTIIDTKGKDVVTMKKTYLPAIPEGGNIKRIRPTKKRRLTKTRKSKKEKKSIKRRRPTKKRRPTKSRRHTKRRR